MQRERPVRRGPDLAGIYDSDAGLPFDPDALEARLTWIWGSPRSGSTWLLRMLSDPLRPDPRQPAGFDAPGSIESADLVPVSESFISNHLAPLVGNSPVIDGRYLPGTLNNRLAEKAPYVFSKQYEEVWRPEYRRLSLIRLHAVTESAQRQGIPIAEESAIVIKEVNGSHAADLVMSLMPRSRMLLLVRDGRDVVDSVLHAYQPGAFMTREGGFSISNEEDRIAVAQRAARSWAIGVDVTLAAMSRHPDRLGRVIRYEDLLADPGRELAALFEWIGLERAPSSIDEIIERHAFSAAPAGERGASESKRAATPGLWRDNLSGGERELVEEILGERLTRFGYDD